VTRPTETVETTPREDLPSHGETARALYDALAAADGRALLGLLAPAFRGEVSAGMPGGVGGVHDGPRAMLAGVWMRVARDFDVTPVPDELIVGADGRVVVVGRYLGSARATGSPVDAAFAHVLTIENGRILRLQQITDTHQWRVALAPAALDTP
jgi:ketosteroid isomerase-like protein